MRESWIDTLVRLHWENRKALTTFNRNFSTIVVRHIDINE